MEDEGQSCAASPKDPKRKPPKTSGVGERAPEVEAAAPGSVRQHAVLFMTVSSSPFKAIIDRC